MVKVGLAGGNLSRLVVQLSRTGSKRSTVSKEQRIGQGINEEDSKGMSARTGWTPRTSGCRKCNDFIQAKCLQSRRAFRDDLAAAFIDIRTRYSNIPGDYEPSSSVSGSRSMTAITVNVYSYAVTQRVLVKKELQNTLPSVAHAGITPASNKNWCSFHRSLVIS